ncbi:hypothetical protein Dimus_016895 [Dionaea muscipula]
MPVKRSRIVRSSSIGNGRGVGVGSGFVALPLVETPPALRLPNRETLVSSVGVLSNFPNVLKPSDQNRRQILSLGSPLREFTDESDVRRNEEEIDDFLERCYYCKKKIRDDSEVFMYSNLRAFCTAGCREIQIALDKEPEKISGKLAKSMALQQGTKRIMDQFGS